VASENTNQNFKELSFMSHETETDMTEKKEIDIMVENDVAFCFFLLRLGFSNTKQMSSSDLITVEAPSCWTV